MGIVQSDTVKCKNSMYVLYRAYADLSRCSLFKFTCGAAFEIQILFYDSYRLCC